MGLNGRWQKLLSVMNFTAYMYSNYEIDWIYMEKPKNHYFSYMGKVVIFKILVSFS